jgi:hypothetical protein
VRAKPSITEEAWLALGDPVRMLQCLPQRSSKRKWRLFACACCRRIWERLPDKHCREAVAVAERFADGEVDDEAREAALSRAKDAAERFGNGLHQALGNHAAARSAVRACMKNAGDALHGAAQAAECAARHKAAVAYGARSPSPEGPISLSQRMEAEQKEQRAIVLDLVGPLPFRPRAADPAWLAWADGSAGKLAQAIYRERAFDQLPVLADALEDAGCSDGELLGHLRGGGPHVPGCWALDLILGEG